MKTLNLEKPQAFSYGWLKIGAIMTILVLLWPILQHWMWTQDGTSGYIDPSVALLVLLALMSYLLLLCLSWLLLKHFWLAMGLPGLGIMVLQFQTLELWQQLGFYWASFALLVLAGVCSLGAIF
jgi:hypothetical protein